MTPLSIFRCLTCILSAKNTVYINIPKFMKIHIKNDDLLNKIITKFQRN